MNKSRFFNFTAAWPEGSDDVADITISLGRNVLSKIVDSKENSIRDYFRASATGVALWFAENWWRLRSETIAGSSAPTINWRLRHELNAAQGGALWPPVTIYSVGDRIAFVPSIGKRTFDGPQYYLESDVAMVQADDYESELDNYFESVLAHCARTVDGAALRSLLTQIAVERKDPELAAWRRLEACLGFDPDAAPDEVINSLVELENITGEGGVEEAARAQPGVDAPQQLRRAIEAARESTVRIDLSLAEGITRHRELPLYASPWQMAETAVAELRSIIGVPRGPIEHTDMEEIFKARWTDLKSATATARNLPYATRLGDENDARVALQTQKSCDRRFELARQFGDRVWQKNSNFGVVSRSKSDRQKFQRAFATNLLCPINDLQQALDVNSPTQEAMEKVASKFKVHPSVVRNQLVYKGYLPFDNMSEKVEAA